MGRKHREVEVIVRGVLQRGTNVLVCKSVKHQHLYLPGGHVEFGECAKTALEREFVEETGLRVKVGKLIAVGDHHFVQRGKRRHELNVVFHVEHFGRQRFEVHSREDEIEFEWIGVSRLAARNMLPRNFARKLPALLKAGRDAATWLSEM